MQNDDVVCSLDLGTNQVKCAIAVYDFEICTRMATAAVPCMSVKGGIIKDTEAAVAAVTQVVEICEGQTHQKVKGVYLGIRQLNLIANIFKGASPLMPLAMKVVNQAGFFVYDVIDPLEAVGRLFLSSKESESGCLVLDFGGQMVSLGIFYKGRLRSSMELNLGSEIITRDIACALEIPINAARIVKKRASLLKNDQDGVSFQAIDEQNICRVTVRALSEIVQPRIEEIFSLIRKWTRRSKYKNAIISNGAVLTGGGALLKGLLPEANKLLGFPVRLGVPQHGSFISLHDVNTHNFSTVLGLVNFVKYGR